MADLRRYYGIALTDCRARMGVLEFAALALNLPQDSATSRSIDPRWWVTPEVEFLRLAEHRLRYLAWQQSEDASKKPPRNVPELLPLDKGEGRQQRIEKGAVIGDAMSREQMDAAIGWTDDK